jgi:hypothetical protein
MVWHVRTGDVCLNCRTAYYSGLFIQLQRALGGRRAAVTFESQHPLKFGGPRQLADLPEFAGARFVVKDKLINTVCRFLTADVLLTTGSSLPAMVAAFAAPWAPIVVEERQKGRIWEQPWYNDKGNAVLVMNGKVKFHSNESLQALFEGVLDRRDAGTLE